MSKEWEVVEVYPVMTKNEKGEKIAGTKTLALAGQ